MPTFRKVKPGDPLRIPSEDYNGFCDAARAFFNTQYSQDSGSLEFGRDWDEVLVLNTGADVTEFGILGIDGPLFSPTDNLNEFQYNTPLTCSTPDKTKHLGKFVVTLEPIANGQMGMAVVSGLIPTQVYGAATGGFADMTDGTVGYLTCGGSGPAQVIWSQSGTALRWALVRLGPPASSGAIFVVLSGTLPARSGATPGSVTATIYTFDGTSLSSTGTTLTVYNNIAASVSQYMKDGSSTKYLKAILEGTRYFLLEDDCN